MLRILTLLGVAGLLTLTSYADAQDKKSEPKKTPGVFTHPNDPSLPVDFQIQGEYEGLFPKSKDKLGAQVIALGGGQFQAVVLPGGLPGAGWDGKSKILMHGKLDGEGATFTPIDPKEKRKYLAQKPEEFSATSKFPPDGHQLYAGAYAKGKITGKTADNEVFELTKVQRKSPTLSLSPTQTGTVVLFDGSNIDAFKGGRLDKATKLLNTDGSNIHTKNKFLNYTVHLEFMLPFRPDARGQGRGNSGFYQVDQYECQILDSFGLDGKDNECGGFYQKVSPKLNMCYPPLTWQTYDIDFTAAVLSDGKKVKNARATVKHNGVVIHDDVELNGVTGGARPEPEGTPGALQLQGHGNPLQFQNFWILPRK